MPDPLQAYAQLRTKVDDFFRGVLERYPGAVRCQRGCDDCCHRDLELFPFEVEALVAGARDLDAERLAGVLERADRASRDPEAPCPILEDGACALYPHRPVLCRTHGLALLVPETGSVSICPHNFQGLARIEGPFVLDLGPLNQILASIHHLMIPVLGCGHERVSISRTLLERFARVRP